MVVGTLGALQRPHRHVTDALKLAWCRSRHPRAHRRRDGCKSAANVLRPHLLRRPGPRQHRPQGSPHRNIRFVSREAGGSAAAKGAAGVPVTSPGDDKDHRWPSWSAFNRDSNESALGHLARSAAQSAAMPGMGNPCDQAMTSSRSFRISSEDSSPTRNSLSILPCVSCTLRHSLSALRRTAGATWVTCTGRRGRPSG